MARDQHTQQIWRSQIWKRIADSRPSGVGVGNVGSWPPLGRQLELPSIEHQNFSTRWGTAVAETADVKGFTLVSLLHTSLEVLREENVNLLNCK